MTTYIYQKDYTLWAFEGPEEPVKSFEAAHYVSAEHEFKQAHFEWQESMSTARESALPVVNAELVAVSRGIPQQMIFSIYKSPLPNVTVGETVPLPGWALEKVYQKLNEFEKPSEWLEVSKTEFDYFNSNIDLMGTYRQAYRLVRSEPEKKPYNSAHSFTEGADTGERFYMNFQTGHNAVKPSESQEETHNCAECNAPLIKKKNTTVIDPSTLLCHSCWTETWAILFQMIREGKYDQCKEKFTITRK